MQKQIGPSYKSYVHL